MEEPLRAFVANARSRHLSDDVIRQKLEAEGWRADDIDRELGEEPLVVPKPSYTSHESHAPAAAPISVVENLTPKGFEYKLFSVALILALLGLLILANVFISGSDNMSVAAFPVTLLVVAAPVALFLFFRLRYAEIATPALRHDPSRRKVVQAIQLVTFLAVIIHTVTLLYLVLSGHYVAPAPAAYSGAYGTTTSPSPNLLADIARWLITLLVAGGVFAYYWIDERRSS